MTWSNFLTKVEKYTANWSKPPKKILKSEKKQSPLIPRYAGIHRITTNESHLHAKHMKKMYPI
jgi:hypothetical protein